MNPGLGRVRITDTDYGADNIFKELRISARGTPRGGVAFFKEFRISARGIPRGGGSIFQGTSYFCKRNP